MRVQLKGDVCLTRFFVEKHVVASNGLFSYGPLLSAVDVDGDYTMAIIKTRDGVVEFDGAVAMP